MTQSGQDSGQESGEARDLSESDPNGGGPDGLAGGMGVSSERTGRVRGTPGEVSHGTEDTSADGTSNNGTSTNGTGAEDTSADPHDSLPD